MPKPESKEKSWNLEDEDDDEEETAEKLQIKIDKETLANSNLKRKKQQADDEEDPLDAYMKEIYKKKTTSTKIVVAKKIKNSPSQIKEEVKTEPIVQVEAESKPVEEAPKKKVLIMTGVAKKKDVTKPKGIQLF